MIRRFRVICCCAFLAFTAAASLQAGAIHDAAAKGDVAKVKAVLKKAPVQLNARDKDGATALHWAVAKGRIGVVELLINSKADVNAKKKDGVTPLHVAAALGQTEAAQLLIAHKANISAVDGKGRTPLSIAQSSGHKDIAEILSANGSKTPAPTGEAVKRTESAPAPNADIITLAKNILDQLVRQDFEGVFKTFDPTMKAGVPVTTLRNTWQTLVTQAGSYQKQVNAKKMLVEGHDVAVITCQFEKAMIDLSVAFDSTKQVSGLYLLPSNP